MSMSSLYLASGKSTWDFLNVLFGQIARMIVQDLGRAVSPRAHWVLFWLKNRRFNASVEIIIRSAIVGTLTILGLYVYISTL